MTQICYLAACLAPGGECEFNEDCPEGEYCETTVGRCLPARPGAEECTWRPPVAPFTPAFQCAYTAPPAGDRTPGHVQVFGLVVADFDLDDDPDTVRPSIVFNTFPSGSPYYHSTGVLRIIDGRTCALQQSMNESSADYTVPIAPPAAGDIDGDGRPEIVAVADLGGLVAFRYDTGAGII